MTPAPELLNARWLLWRASKAAQGFNGGPRENAAYMAWIGRNKTAYLAASKKDPLGPLDQDAFTLFLRGER